MKSKSTEPDTHNNEKQNFRLSMVVLKGLFLFLVINILFASIGDTGFGKFSLYNHVFPGRLRLPFGENPTEAYNFSLDNLDAMFASHVISGVISTDEFRVIVIGDSSTWGILLRPEETLAGVLEDKLEKCGNRNIKVYNLGYPTLSLTKDIMILSRAMQYKPDLIIWLVTLEAFPFDKQLSSPIVSNNLNELINITTIYNLEIGIPQGSEFSYNFFQKSIFGQRRALADLLRLQLYGVMWSATSIDQIYPLDFDKAQINLDNDLRFHDMAPNELKRGELAFEVLEAGKNIAGDVPFILINEPILISNGDNSDIRYNFYYPRWAYDQYRMMLSDYALERSWDYYDFWDIIPMAEFTNSAIHLTPEGETILADYLYQQIQLEACAQ